MLLAVAAIARAADTNPFTLEQIYEAIVAKSSNASSGALSIT